MNRINGFQLKWYNVYNVEEKKKKSMFQAGKFACCLRLCVRSVTRAITDQAQHGVNFK